MGLRTEEQTIQRAADKIQGQSGGGEGGIGIREGTGERHCVVDGEEGGGEEK